MLANELRVVRDELGELPYSCIPTRLQRDTLRTASYPFADDLAQGSRWRYPRGRQLRRVTVRPIYGATCCLVEKVAQDITFSEWLGRLDVNAVRERCNEIRWPEHR